ncbi:hypothetical protein Tco_0609213 [Tanacetum coccineum]
MDQKSASLKFPLVTCVMTAEQFHSKGVLANSLIVLLCFQLRFSRSKANLGMSIKASESGATTGATLALRIWITMTDLKTGVGRPRCLLLLAEDIVSFVKSCYQERVPEPEVDAVLAVQILKHVSQICHLGLQVFDLGFLACFQNCIIGCDYFFQNLFLTHRVSEEQVLDGLTGEEVTGGLGHILLDIVMVHVAVSGLDSSATSDETAGVEELVLILATTALFPFLNILEAFCLRSYHRQQSSMNLDQLSLGHYRMYRVDAILKTHDEGIPLKDHWRTTPSLCKTSHQSSFMKFL